MQGSGFPKIKGKYAFESMVLPEAYLKTRFKDKIGVRNSIFIYSANLLGSLRKKMELQKASIYSPKSCIETYLNKDRDLLVVRLPAGAPLTATTLEELHVLGVKRFFIFGAAGSLNHAVMPGSIVLCTKAVRDEGTSHHYVKPSLFAYPDRKEVEIVARIMRDHGISFYSGPTWTIDAPYRETIKEVEHYRKMGIFTVEMEAAALFVVAKEVGAHACAVFGVSDLLDKEWSSFVHTNNTYTKIAEIISLLFPPTKSGKSKGNAVGYRRVHRK